MSRAARERLADAIIGVSAHSLADVAAAAATGADYVTLSPIFLTESKPGYGPALGIESLRTAAALGIPVLALAGVDCSDGRQLPCCRRERGRSDGGGDARAGHGVRRPRSRRGV